jgi:signal transduction histidine kinase
VTVLIERMGNSRYLNAWRRLFFIALFLPSFLLHAQENLNAAGEFIILDGTHKFSPGDDTAFSSPSYDDSAWQPIMVPGSWQAQGVRPEKKNTGWYRIHFHVPAGIRYPNPAILLGRIGDADEVFFNGVKIGGEGLISEGYVEATKVERLYRIHSDLIRYDDDNILAVRVMNTYLNGGIFDKNVSLGDYDSLLIEKYGRDKYVIIIEFCFFTFFAIFFMTCLFFFVKGLRDREYIFFWLFVSLYGFLFSLGSLAFYETGYKSPFIQMVINTIAILLPANLFILIMNVCREKMNAHARAILMSYLFIVLMVTLFPFFTVKQHFYVLWKILFVVTAAFLFFYALKAYLRKFYESAPILLGITGLIIGFVLESVGGLDLLQFTGFFLWDYSTTFFLICVMYALTARYIRIKDLQSASVRIFKAHEDERKRLARELHDGIGTSLLAIKLKLQVLDAKTHEHTPVEREEIPELVSEISHVIDELREVIMDLRPSFLENVELTDAVQWHARKVQERLGITIHISLEGAIQVSSRIKEMVYRIYQEAISNALKHSGADRIEVTLKRDGHFLLLEVKDNGKGFDTGRREITGTGMGLDTIKERVELLGGFLNIRSSDKMGTSLFIEVPVE